MLTFFFLILFIFLSFAPLLLSCTPVLSRRVLHQPFFPLDAVPPSPPPSPPPQTPPSTPPKFPFSSTSTSTSTNSSPFFPFYPSPPPPPSPATFASFPANISSLIVPHSQKPKSNSSKLLIVAITAVISAAVVAGVLAFLYCRRRGNSSASLADDSKTYTSDNSHRVYLPPHGETRHNSNKFSASSTNTSSEFLYLGTLVNSRRIEDISNSRSNAGSVSRKMESPELRPLPPLSRQSFKQNCEAASIGEEDEEEFYSPRGSIGTGSGSRRVFAAIAAQNVGARNSDSSTSSSSSSSSGSPSRSMSISISTPVTLSPRRSEPKSPEPTAVILGGATPPLEPLNLQRISPDGTPVRKSDSSHSSDRNVLSSPTLSMTSTSPDIGLVKSTVVVSNQQMRSPPYSSASSSPERDSERKQEESVETFNDLDPNVQSPLRSSASTSVSGKKTDELDQNPHSSLLTSASTSPDRALQKKTDEFLKRFNDLDRNLHSSLISCTSVSPERDMENKTEEFLKSANDSDEDEQSPLLSSASTSPERDLEKKTDEFLKTFNDSDRNLQFAMLSSASTSPERNLEKKTNEFLKTVNHLDRNVQSSPVLSSASTSPERGLVKTPDAYAQSPLHSSASTSPDRGVQSNHSSFPMIFSDLNRKVKSIFLSSLSASPEVSSQRNSDAYPNQGVRSTSVTSSSSSSAGRIINNTTTPLSSNGSLMSSLSSSPERERDGINSSPDASFNNADSKQPLSVSQPPPPPPLPPPYYPQRQLGNQNPFRSSGQPISKPPPLIPPSRPFMIQNLAKGSPVEQPSTSGTLEPIGETPKPKLKPLHWDKVRASSDREMVWDHLRSSSFTLNEEMIETLFVVKAPDSKLNQTTPRTVLPSPNQENRVLDPKKAQNIAILLRAVNVTVEEVCDALLEGNADNLGTELLESLLKMAPTKEEERNLNEYKDDSPFKLGPAEKFLKAVLDVPFAFKRVDAMLYMSNFESEVEFLKRAFETLEAACEELRNSRMFLKLLEAVLKTGNRMNVGTNRGDAHAFKLDTLLKLVDVKGADGKTTLLHFVVQEIIRTEGTRLSGTSQVPNPALNEDVRCRKLGLQVVSGLSSDLTNVKKAAAMDSEVLSSDVSNLSRGLEKINAILELNKTTKNDETFHRFSESMYRFIKTADEEIIRIQAQESVALSLVKEITEYFHGNSAKEEAHPFRIFLVVRDFLAVLDRVCKEVGTINERTTISSAHRFPVPVNPMMIPVLPVFHGRQHCGSSDDEIGR